MTTLQTTTRPHRQAAHARRDHLDVFREFLRHLDRAARARPLQRLGKSEKERAPRKR